MQIGFKHLFKSKCTQTWSYLELSSVENNNTADLTYSLKNSEQYCRLKRGTAQPCHDTNIKGATLFSTQLLNSTQWMLKNGKTGDQHKPHNDKTQQ
jgi:hypothetical protein